MLMILVPEHCDVDLADEFANVIAWADVNKMIINRTKTKEIVFRRPCPIRHHLLPLVNDIELVNQIESLGVILHQGLNFEMHITAILKQCIQRMYMLRMLRSQGMSANHLNTVFVALVISHLLYALPAWGMFVSAGQCGRIDAFLRHAHKMWVL